MTSVVLRRATLRRLLFAVPFFFAAASLAAQAKPPQKPPSPSGQDASGIRQQILSSGLTPDQIRQRLTSRGMSATLLDPFMTAGTSVDNITPSSDVLAAVGVLAEADQMALDAAATNQRSATILSAPLTRDGLPVYGLSVFRNLTNQFQPNLSGPVDPTYRVGALDVIAIVLTGQVEQSYALEVTRDGFIVIPVVGQVFVANLTLDQATQAIVTRLRGSYAGAGTGTASPTKVYVTVTRLRTNQIFVLGDVVAPGSYQVSAAGTILTALYAAGGPTIMGTMRNIKVIRGRDTAYTFDAYDYLLRGDASKDARLQNGDRVFVAPVSRTVAVTGEVLRPGAYEMAPTETLAEAVANAGGYTPLAAANRIQISRILPPTQRAAGGHDRTVFDVTGPELARGAAPRRDLVTGDRIMVFPITGPERDRVAVTGNVWSGGQYGYRRGMKLSDLIKSAGGLKADTYMDEVDIRRQLPDGTQTIYRPRLLDTLGRSDPDVDLQDGDVVQIYSVSEFRPQRYVTVGGAVNNPTQVPYAVGLTLRQAILAAKGLQESAYLKEVEISRMPASRSTGSRAQIFKVPIDSTYLFERGADGKYLGPPGDATRANGAPEVQLLPYDQINVLRQTDWELLSSVSVSGEVKFPGAYTIERRDERISDVIKRAGGLTDRAYAEAFVYRRLITPAEVLNRQQVLQKVNDDRAYGIAMERAQAPLPASGQASAATAIADGGAAAVQQALTKALQLAPESDERIAVDLKKVLEDPNRIDNFRLYPGDQLIVPPYRAIVTVRGMVNAPISVPFHDGASILDYVNAAGGVTANADLTHSFVQQPNSAIEAYKLNPKPRAGSIIVVPPKDIKPPKAAGTPWTAILATFASIATAAAAVIAVSK
ncbi:MAG TPA: SLBB domain-containing protein [Gemmatimonadaceae bacterium]|nr:SLBB domain-containing protein [Gemmatimonadaceae bacterium]